MIYYIITWLIAAGTGSLVISIDADASQRGSVHVAIFHNKTAFDKKSGGMVEKILPYTGQKTYRLEAPALPYGRYAVAVFQDVNGNGKLDSNGLGIPTEPYGFSNNPKVKWSAPTFEETAVALQSPAVPVSIAMKRWKNQ